MPGGSRGCMAEEERGGLPSQPDGRAHHGHKEVTAADLEGKVGSHPTVLRADPAAFCAHLTVSGARLAHLFIAPPASQASEHGVRKLPRYNGEQPPETYLIQVQLATQFNDWSLKETAVQVTLALEGKAVQILTDLQPQDWLNCQKSNTVSAWPPLLW